MIEHTGWRIACLIYAAVHLLVALPIHAAVIRTSAASAPEAEGAAQQTNESDNAPVANEKLIFVLLALVMSIAGAVGSVVVVHLLIFLQARGVDFAVAVTLGTLFGPAQVGARVVERLFGSRYHPIWTLVASVTLMALGLAMLFGAVPALILIIVLYGAGYGISWIARGTVPLALFGPVRFPQLMGKLAFPALIAQALAPSVGAWLIETAGVDATIGVLTLFTLINVVLIAALWAMCRARLLADL